MPILAKLAYMQLVSKFQGTFDEEIDRLILKCAWNWKGSRWAKTFLGGKKETKMENLTLFNLMTL